MPKGNSLPNTRWSLVAELQRSDGMPNQAVITFLEIYSSPLIGFLRQYFQLPQSKSELLFQDFISEKVVIQRIIDLADRRKGRLRSYLIRCLLNFAASELKNQNRYVVANQISNSHANSNDEPVKQATRAWAEHVLEMAIDAVEMECQATGQDRTWEVFRARLIAPVKDGQPAEPYPALMERLNLKGLSEAYNLLNTAKRMFRRELESIIAQYAVDSKEIDQEINELKSIFCK